MNNWTDVGALSLVYGLIILFVISFTFFIRRLLLNSTIKRKQINDLDKKLDRIIELLEKDGKHDS